MTAAATECPPQRPTAIFLMGPTCAGKTALAVQLVRRLPCEIVSVDSAMVYRGMDIGTAKPGPEVLAQAPHRLIDILDPAESYSAARFRADALREMAAVTAGGRIPLLVGGTGLYFRALERGLSPLPAANAEVRERLHEEARTRGLSAVYERLHRLDPQSAARFHHNDSQRIFRAMEVYELAGKPMSQLLGAPGCEGFPYRVIKLVLNVGARGVLHERCGDRFLDMLRRGFLDEVRALFDRGDLHADLPSMRVVGYRQAWCHLAGQIDYQTMTDRAIAATRQLAKRQLTWLRAEPGACWLEAGMSDLIRITLRTLENGFGLSN